MNVTHKLTTEDFYSLLDVDEPNSGKGVSNYSMDVISSLSCLQFRRQCAHIDHHPMLMSVVACRYWDQTVFLLRSKLPLHAVVVERAMNVLL